MDSVTQFFSIIFLLVTFVAIVLVTQLIRRRRTWLVLRPIAVYENTDELGAASIEAGRPLHLAFGSANLGGDGTLLALAGAEWFYHLIRSATLGETSPILSTTDTVTILLANDTLRRAYHAQGLLGRYSPAQARWYPAGRRSIAYAGAVTGLMGDEKTFGHVFAGSFGPELALMLYAANRREQYTAAVSDQLEGQAIAFAMADDVLIGEEIFSAGTYLNPGHATAQGETVTIDLLRWLLIAAMVILFIITALQGAGG